MNYKIVSIFLFLLINTINGQNFNEIVEYHKLNIKNLYFQRGAPQEWVTTGEVSVNSLTDFLGEYKENVAILIYNQVADTLTINLLNKKGELKSSKNIINKNELIKDIEDINFLFSSSHSNQMMEFRGSKANKIKKK